MASTSPLPPLPPSPTRRITQPIIGPGSTSPHKNVFSKHLIHNEPVLITRNPKGTPSDDEINNKYSAVAWVPHGIYQGFVNTQTNILSPNPSKLVQSILPSRNGKTNQWDGPSHVLVKRNGCWISIRTFYN